MNHIYSVLWNAALGRFCVTCEIGRSRNRATTQRSAASSVLRPGLTVLAALVAMAWTAPTWSQGLPQAHQLASGQAQVTSAGQQMTITQSTPKAILNWQSFNIGAGHTVTFAQPDASSVALNRVTGADASAILGKLEANGQVFLVNPNGVLFGTGAQVDVGGLVASTLDISDQDFLKGRYQFTGQGSKIPGAEVINQGTITATNGGAVALLGGQVSNQGTIVARLGSVALAAGNQVTLDFAGDKLLNVSVDEGALNALAENRELIQADGGLVLMTAKATDALLQTVVNNTGRILARSVENRQGRIVLRGGLDEGTVLVSGKLDASAATGDGGRVETRGARVKILAGTQVTTAAAQGKTGVWRIASATDPTVGADGDIGGDTLTNNLAHTSIALQTMATGAGPGDIHINAPVNWSKNRLTLSARRNIHINSIMTASGKATLDLNHGGYSPTQKTPTADSGVHMAMEGKGFIGRVDVKGKGHQRLTINGQDYTLLTSMQAIQDMDLDGHYALAADIDAKDFKKTSHWFRSQGQDYKPVGASLDRPFTGQLQGLGHKISDLRINRQAEPHVGLFGVFSGELSNLGMDAGSVQGRMLGQTLDVAVIETGAFAGRMVGASMRNVYTTAKVTGQAELGSFGSTPLMAMTGGAAGHVEQSYIDNVRVNADVHGSAEGKSPGDAYSAVGGAFGLVQSSRISRVDVQGSVTGRARIRPTISEAFLPQIFQSRFAVRSMGISYVGGAIGDLHGGNVHGISAKNSVQEVTSGPSGSSSSAYKGTSVVSSHAEVGNSAQAETRVINADGLGRHAPTLPAIAYRSLSKPIPAPVVSFPAQVFVETPQAPAVVANTTDTTPSVTPDPVVYPIVSLPATPAQVLVETPQPPVVVANTTDTTPSVTPAPVVYPIVSLPATPVQVFVETPLAPAVVAHTTDTTPSVTPAPVVYPIVSLPETPAQVLVEPPQALAVVAHTTDTTPSVTPAPVVYPIVSWPATPAPVLVETPQPPVVVANTTPSVTPDPVVYPIVSWPATPVPVLVETPQPPVVVAHTTDTTPSVTPAPVVYPVVSLPATPAPVLVETPQAPAVVAKPTDTTPSVTPDPVISVPVPTATLRVAPDLPTAVAHSAAATTAPTVDVRADTAPGPTPMPAANSRLRKPAHGVHSNPAYVSATASAATTATERIAPQPAVAPASEDAPYSVIGSAIRLPAR